MGSIRRQSIFSSIFIYLGFGLGAINLLIFFTNPHFFKTDEFGLTRVLMDFGLLFSSLCTIGTVPVAQRFFPFYDSYLHKKNNDLPFLTLSFCIIGCILFLILTTVFKENIIRKFGTRSPLFVTHFYLIYPITLSYAFFSLMESYAWALRKSILSNFLKEVLFRLLTTIIILLYVFNFISIETFFDLYSFIYFPSFIILFIIIIRSGGFPFNFSVSSVTRRLYKKIVTFGLFIFAGSALNVISRTISGIIIASQSVNGLTDTAIFMIPTFMVTILDVPQRSMISTAVPVIAEAWKDRDKNKILEIYQKTSLNLLIFGMALGGAIYLNMDNAVRYLGNTYLPIKMLALILGIAKLIDLGTGLNSQILVLSKYWKVDFGTNMLFVFMSIPLNYYLIKTRGVVGAAYADLIAIAVFNLVRFIYILVLFKIQPFTFKTLFAIVIGIGAIILVRQLPFLGNLYFDAVIRSLLFLVIFAPLIIAFRISSDIYELYGHFLNRLKKIKE